MNKQIVLVIGGPGKSGSTTIAKRLAKHFGLKRVYGGKLFREGAKVRGFDVLEDFYKQCSLKEMEELDKEVDNKLRDLAKKGNIIIESKVFAGIADKEGIDCSAKIWITADLDTRVYRAVEKEGMKNLIAKWIRKNQIKSNLKLRYKKDKIRYRDLYNVDYDHPEKYNDLVIDSSYQAPDETFNLIINFLNNAGIK